MKKKSTKSKAVTKPLKPQANGMIEGSVPYKFKVRQNYATTIFANDYVQNVNPSERTLILSRAREIYSNIGAVKNALHEISQLVVGEGWIPQYQGLDKEWGNKAETFLQSWMQICDYRGRPWDFHTVLKNICLAVERDGDILVVLTESSTSPYPRIQLIPSHRIGSRTSGDKVKGGLFDGYNIHDGIITNDAGVTVGYSILGGKIDGSEDQQVSVNDAQLIFDADFSDQNRGISALSAAICDWDDYKTIKGFEIKGIKNASNYGVIMHVPAEQVDSYAAENDDVPFGNQIASTNGLNTDFTIRTTTLQGGETPVFTAGAGAKLETLESNRPAPNTQLFLRDHVLRHCFLSLRWPIEMTFDMDSKGATTKLIIAKAQRRIEDTQNRVIMPIWKRIINYTIAKAIKYGYLPKNQEWYKFEPTLPRSFSIENFRDVKSDLELYNKGIITATQLAGQLGYEFADNLEKKAQELAYRNELANKYGVNAGELMLLTPNGNQISDSTQTTDNTNLQ